MRVAPFGESAVYLDLGIERAPDRAARTLAAAAALRAAFSRADVVAGAGAVMVVGDFDSGEARAVVERSLAAPPAPLEGARLHVISAVYDGPDLAAAAASLGVAPEALVEMHAEREVLAELAGFLPGFAYLGPIDPRIVLPRRPSPRPAVPARSIGVAGEFTGVYPGGSPGGWNLIARALDVVLFDPKRDRPMLIEPGDRVRFVPAPPGSVGAPNSKGDPAGACETRPGATRALEIMTTSACATIQDRGRRGQLAIGIPPSGPVDPRTFEAANRATGNDPGAAAIEVLLGGLRARARGSLLISIDGSPASRLEDGDELRVAANERAVRYIAVRGGVAVPNALGARSTLLSARLGGFEGRPLRRGDIVPIGPDTDCDAPSAEDIALDPGGLASLEIDPGPHIDRFPEGALDALLATAWRVSHLGDRVGVRLEGGRVPRDRPDLALPVPMRRGAVQIATDGTPIVLGPDHPVTGGYPVLAVLRRASQARLARLRAGAPVKLVLGR
jgi:KipI family sensor histidine kinase inhibitor